MKMMKKRKTMKTMETMKTRKIKKMKFFGDKSYLEEKSYVVIKVTHS